MQGPNSRWKIAALIFAALAMHETYMQRCFELAKRGAGYVAPNPLVGAVLVHDGKIIGEGWHENYGEAHAEPNCINDAIQNGHQSLLAESTLYVSLEPCAHFGKTPPCADLVIHHKIPQVLVAVRDPFPAVNGKGIEKLQQAGIKTEVGILEKEAREINKRFFTFHTGHRPYIVLKWAQTADRFIANSNGKNSERLLISNAYSNRMVHKWRSEEASILVGTNTALADDPQLTVRHWPGHSPVRLVIDMDLRLPSHLHLFDQRVRTIVFNSIRHGEEGNILYYQVTTDVSIPHQVSNALYQLKLQSVLIEGGAKLLQSFIDEGLWDEARIITNSKMEVGRGLPAPVLGNKIKAGEEQFEHDKITIYKP